MGIGKSKAGILPGTLDMMLLKMPTRGHLHGYAIAQLIQQLSGDLLRVEEGSLSPVLQRLELFYTLTSDGRKHLNAEAARYRQVTGAVARMMGFA